MSVQAADLVGGRYRLERLVGSGGTSDVWAATDERLERKVAVKVFRIAPDDAVAVARGTGEARLLASLAHPHLVAVHDAFVPPEGGDGWIVMELVGGGSLATALASGPLAPASAAVVAAEVADALAALHDRGIVHRDVKPANVLFTRDGVTKLADLGIARVHGSPALTQTGLMMGTAAYLSPEQVRGQSPTGASDVYALGLVLLESLSGVRAYPGPAAEAAIARLTTPPPLGDAPPAYRPVLQQMTADDPAARPTAAAVAAVLRRPASDPTAVLPAPPPEPATELIAEPVVRRRRRTWPVAVALVAVAGIVALLALTAGGSAGSPAGVSPSGSSPSPSTSAPTTAPTTAASTPTPTSSSAAAREPGPGPAGGGGPGGGGKKGGGPGKK